MKSDRRSQTEPGCPTPTWLCLKHLRGIHFKSLEELIKLLLLLEKAPKVLMARRLREGKALIWVHAVKLKMKSAVSVPWLKESHVVISSDAALNLEETTEWFNGLYFQFCYGSIIAMSLCSKTVQWPPGVRHPVSPPNTPMFKLENNL